MLVQVNITCRIREYANTVLTSWNCPIYPSNTGRSSSSNVTHKGIVRS